VVTAKVVNVIADALKIDDVWTIEGSICWKADGSINAKTLDWAGHFEGLRCDVVFVVRVVCWWRKCALR
jgi:hypothetical protein